MKFSTLCAALTYVLTARRVVMRARGAHLFECSIIYIHPDQGPEFGHLRGQSCDCEGLKIALNILNDLLHLPSTYPSTLSLSLCSCRTFKEANAGVAERAQTWGGHF